MMEAIELRIGNWYDHNGEFKQVNPNTIIEVFESERVWCKPIQLTEEWLLRFGFKKILHSIKGTVLKDEYEKGFVRISHYMGQFDFMGCTNINSVNKLQNLYFALTGQELELK